MNGLGAAEKAASASKTARHAGRSGSIPVTLFQADYKAWLAADPPRYIVLLRAQVALAWLDRGQALRGPKMSRRKTCQKPKIGRRG